MSTQPHIPVRAAEAAWSPAVSAPRKAADRRPKWLFAAVGLAIVASAAYLIRSRLAPGTVNPNIQVFNVAMRSFPVSLQQRGELRAANSIDIRSELEGKSTIIYLINEGAHVRKGDLLVELASDDIDEKIRDAEIKVATAQAAYEAGAKEREILVDEDASKVRKAELALQMARLAFQRYDEGDKVQLRQDATLALEKAKSVLQRAQEYQKDSEGLFKQGYITKIDLENDRFKSYEASIDLKKAELALQVLDKYTAPMDMRDKQSTVSEAVKDLDRTKKSATASEAKANADVAAKKSEFDLTSEKLGKLRDQKSKAKIYAPAEGLVVYYRAGNWWKTDSDIEAGSQVYERQLLIQLPDTTSMKVVVRVHEAQTEHLKVGLPATVDIEGFSGRQFTGKVTRIAVLADSQNRYLNPNLKEYETDILLDGKFSELKPGTTSRAEIQLAQLTGVLAVPVQCVFAKGGRYFVFVDEAGTSRPAEVQVGLASTEYVEIKSGLSEGQNVRLAVTDDMKLMLPDNENTKEIGGKRSEGTPPRRSHRAS